MRQPVFRFAPSPNGRLHLGHAYSALLNADLAQRMGGRLLLRIEDIDLSRCRDEFVAGIFEDLEWLGLRWEEPPRRQSEHFGDYRAAFERLRAEGLVYPCFCSRKVAAGSAGVEAAGSLLRDPDGVPLYGGACRRLPAPEAEGRLDSEAHTWRLDMEAASKKMLGPRGYHAFADGEVPEWRPARPDDWGDAIIRRRDVPTSYYLSVVVDDALQGVTHVVRGRDLEAATDLHVLLQALLGLPTPLYHHHTLLTDSQGGKLAKSKGSDTLEDLRLRGISAAAIRRELGFA